MLEQLCLTPNCIPSSNEKNVADQNRLPENVDGVVMLSAHRTNTWHRTRCSLCKHLGHSDTLHTVHAMQYLVFYVKDVVVSSLSGPKSENELGFWWNEYTVYYLHTNWLQHNCWFYLNVRHHFMMQRKPWLWDLHLAGILQRDSINHSTFRK